MTLVELFVLRVRLLENRFESSRTQETELERTKRERERERHRERHRQRETERERELWPHESILYSQCEMIQVPQRVMTVLLSILKLLLYLLKTITLY